MRAVITSGLLPILALALSVTSATAMAAERVVVPGAGALASAIADAQAGDILRLEPGHYFGPIVIDRPLTLTGGAGAVVDGAGNGTVITVAAPGVTINGLTVTGSGADASTLDAGIKLLKGSEGAIVSNNILKDNLVGIDVHGARDARVRGNSITGRRHHRMNARGNGIYVWNSPGLIVEENDVRYGRDGIFVNTSRKNIFRNNRFRDLRFAVHYMYANDSEVSGNRSTGNHLGYAIMYSKKVRIVGNVSEGDRDHGVMLNYTNDSLVEGNLVRGAEKCTFIYNANRNRLLGNRYEGCGIGVHFTAGSERNQIAGNSFVSNRVQVKYVGSRWIEWSLEGRGNYWSDNAAYDVNGDGIGDTPHRPNDIMDHVLWRQPAAKLLLGSPAVQLVRWSQKAFPALMPGGITDSHPLMRPLPVASRKSEGPS